MSGDVTDGTGRPATMADIAAHLGVSRQLVSLVLRNAPGASEETRRRVRQAAKDLGFSPHVGAQSLRRTRSTDYEARAAFLSRMGYRVICISLKDLCHPTRLALEVHRVLE